MKTYSDLLTYLQGQILRQHRLVHKTPFIVANANLNPKTLLTMNQYHPKCQ